MSRPLLLVNARARAGARMRWLDAIDPSRVERCDVDAPEMTRRLRACVADGAERVLVAGGDGTVHLALQQLAGGSCALGIVPCGSGNDFAASLGLPDEPQRALEVALDAALAPVDLGRIDGRFFGCVSGVGIDGHVLDVIESWRRRPPAALLYPLALFRALPGFRAPTVEIEHDGGRWRGPATIVAVANTPRYGGGMRVAPAARVDDGLLDVVVVGELPVLRLLTLFPGVYGGGHVDHPAVVTFRTRAGRLRVDGSERLNADGELLLRLRPGQEIAFSVAPEALLVAGSPGRSA